MSIKPIIHSVSLTQKSCGRRTGLPLLASQLLIFICSGQTTLFGVNTRINRERVNNVYVSVCPIHFWSGFLLLYSGLLIPTSPFLSFNSFVCFVTAFVRNAV